MKESIGKAARELTNGNKMLDNGRESCPFYYPDLRCNAGIFSNCIHIEGEEYHSCMIYQNSVNNRV
ncbi:MAG: hypothetical protein QXI33_01925 [Candidatus Pacearchaeota archaeon]